MGKTYHLESSYTYRLKHPREIIAHRHLPENVYRVYVYSCIGVLRYSGICVGVSAICTQPGDYLFNFLIMVLTMKIILIYYHYGNY